MKHLGPFLAATFLLLARAEASPPVLDGPRSTAPLEVAGFRAAEHVVPAGATSPRPVVIVLHGNFDRPEWECAAWAPILAGRAFLLCPRGIPRTDAPGQDRWEYGGRAAILREVAAGRAALEARYPGFVDAGPDLWVGFSLGAIHLSAMLRRDASAHPRAVLVEGGLDGWDHRSARRFAARGGRKLAFACGREGCRRNADRITRLLAEAGAEGRVAFAPVGHSFGGALTGPTRVVFDWLVADDPRFARRD